nr:PAS domain S-box protein [Desulfobacula sp.]
MPLLLPGNRGCGSRFHGTIRTSGGNPCLFCRQNFQEGQGTPASLISGQPRGFDAIIGGGCLEHQNSGDENQAHVIIPETRLCFHLVAPAALVDSLIAEGAYLTTPGWLSDWRQYVTDWGFDQETARQFFRETTKKLILLDTGVYKDCLAELSAMGEYLNLPVQSIPVGLDMLRLSLEHLVVKLQQNRKFLPPPDHFFADHLMVIDLMNILLVSNSEKDAIDHIKDLFSLLFAPGRIVYTPAGHGLEYPALKPGEKFAWTRSGQGFVIPLEYKGGCLGILEIDDLAFAEYKERYLALALPLTEVCSAAISNARVQEARQASEQALQRIARIVESSDDAIIGKNLDGIIVSWNRGAKQVYGYEENEVLGKHISFLTPQDQPDEMPRVLEKIKAGQPGGRIETTWVTKNGSLLNVSLQVSPIRDADERIVGVSSIARDITAEKQRVEQEKRSLEAQLQQSQKLESVGRLAGGVAHDFNNMLAVIIGYSNFGLEDSPKDSDMHQNLEEILQAAERAKGLTRQLLAFARKQVLEMSSLSLNTVIKDFGKMIQRLIGEDITIKMMLEDGIPQIDADSGMMEQILLNLSVNARDAMPDGGTLTLETMRVTLDEDHAAKKLDVKPGNYLMLSVADTGKGMDEKTRQMIFEPFFTTKGPGKGTGLGLSTVYGIVRQHQGTIWVYSEPSHGTIFKIYFPVSRMGETTGKKRVEAEPAPAGGETILVVEDERKIRMVVCTALTRLGYSVLPSGSPAEAREIEKQHQGIIHLMLTDVVMPGMNGKELYEALRPSRPAMRALFMSGYTENVIAERGILKEGINFIQKPFSIKELALKMGSVLSQKNETDGINSYPPLPPPPFKR